MFIEIGSTTPGNCGPIIDEVSLVLAPNSLPTTVPSNPEIPNPETSSSSQNPVITTRTVPGILPNDAKPTVVLDSQDTLTPDSSSVLENVNTSSTQTLDPSSSIAPSKEISTGAIVGISIAAFSLSIGLVAAFYFLYYKRRRGTASKDKILAIPPNPNEFWPK
jgi:hypothetical protein